MIVPKINWIPFDKNNPPNNLPEEIECLIFLREDDYNNGTTWHYHTDIATPYGNYLDNYWNSLNDWKEGQLVEVLAYATLPSYIKESDLIEIDP